MGESLSEVKADLGFCMHIKKGCWNDVSSLGKLYYVLFIIYTLFRIFFLQYFTASYWFVYIVLFYIIIFVSFGKLFIHCCLKNVI